MTDCLLSTAYLPPIAWFQHLLLADAPKIESKENYIKQSYRNRCKILTANGLMDLSIPVLHKGSKQSIDEILIQDEIAWRKQHWNAICSAYGKSAFFLYYRDAFEHFYAVPEKEQTLFEFNAALIRHLLKLLKIQKEIQFTETYTPESDTSNDKRNAFLAKGEPREAELVFSKKYYQVFSEKFPTQCNLSIIDLLFNQGPRSIDFLQEG